MLVRAGIVSFLLLICFSSTATATATATADQLESYLWQNRPLLIFADKNDNPQLNQLKHKLAQRQCNIEDREIVVGILVENGDRTLDDKQISSAYATALRSRYRVDDQAFAVILVGKDGGEKYRLYELPDLDEIFALIDGMPMRQVEMMETPSTCGRT